MQSQCKTNTVTNKKSRGFIIRMIQKLVGMIIMAGVIAMLAIGVFVYKSTEDLPNIDKMVRMGVNPSRWTQVLATDGTPILSYGKYHHRDVSLDQVSPHFVDALIATEDRRFFKHKGVDPIAIARAMVRNVTKGKMLEGGSTLTQQLARNVFLSNERSFKRKIREASLAWKLEQELEKEEILELYINNTYFGEGAYGIEAASEVYFGKKPGSLTLDEAALLAGMPQAPSRYNPYLNPKDAKARRDEVIDNLLEVEKISAADCEKFKKKPLKLNKANRALSASNKAPYFNRYVMNQVMKHFDLDEQSFWHSGLKIYTTLNLRAQRAAQTALVSESSNFGRTGLKQQGAVLSIDPKSGALLAYIGGKDYQESQFDRVVQATRSPGSLFKVFTYTTAIDKGFEPTRVYLDEPISFGNWRPMNYDKGHHGYMTMAGALARSNNVIAVKVMNDVTPEATIDVARRMGIHSKLDPGLALTLGGSGVNLLEITSAIGVLANQGVRVEPYAVEKIVDSDGKLIYRHHGTQVNVLSRTTVDTMVKMMSGVVKLGTGRRANIGRPMAGKTGTSDDYRDAWFIGYTPNVITGVWVGNDDNSSMKGMSGGGLPAQIWRTYMQSYMSGRMLANFDLSYSKSLADADFTSYDLDNLSDGENNNPLAVNEVQPGLLDTNDPNAPDMADMEPLVPDDGYQVIQPNSSQQPNAVGMSQPQNVAPIGPPAPNAPKPPAQRNQPPPQAPRYDVIPVPQPVPSQQR